MAGEIADIVLTNGVVYTADQANTVCEAVAIKDNRILFVGGSHAAEDYLGGESRKIDLAGRMVIPGMLDTHIHPPGLSLLELYEVQLAHCNSLGEYLDAVKNFIAQRPDIEAVYGRGWSWSVLQGDELNKGPRKEYLDAVTQDIPVILRANDGHTLWLNSKALAVNGVTTATPTPAGGIIEKDPLSGELWGTLKEGAMRLIALPQYSMKQYREAIIAFQQKMNSFGITGILCLGSLAFQTIFEVCGELEQQGRLQLRVRGAVTVQPQEDLPKQFEAIDRLRRQYHTLSLQVTAAKFFTDGVVEGGTSHLLEPYAPPAGKGADYCGSFLWDMKELRQAFYLTNAANLQIHVHSTGDASTRKVLDALEYVRQQALKGDYRNTITHLQLVDPSDIPRFRQLDVVASVQPYWHFKSAHWWNNVDYRFLGQRAETEYPLGSFFAQGITVASSSDYPATVVPNPLLAMDIGVTRNMDRGSLYGLEDITDMNDERYLLNSKERATIQQMIKSFTINGAYAMFMEKEIGSIEAGKLADLVVLDQNLLTVPAIDIDKASVDMTFFDGRLVYEKNK
ncbi:amidohydrolase [Acetonema longum]|uniref:Amidohydrolase 3 domain-containing protein n=1 Tax=Acetonema longum DSM 6540 TaxID=1009370 RepID=F7NMI5_9FIRM|nr:amidohydrolase [Acetonema longum]EGO62725.1 hypothetical protein ALO_16577 [Acetonema longum DSM 6540]